MNPAKPGRFGPFVALALLASGCASGPADFVDLTAEGATLTPAASVRTDAERGALEADLVSTGDRQAARGAAADNGLPSAMALAIIRQQQTEEARALIAETVPVAPAPVSAAPAAAAPAPTVCPPATEGVVPAAGCP